MLPFPITFDPAAQDASRVGIQIVLVPELADSDNYRAVLAENVDMILKAVGRFAALLQPAALLRSRPMKGDPSTYAFELDFDRPRPDMLRMILNGCASHGYEPQDNSPLFAEIRVHARPGGAQADATMLLAPHPFTVQDDTGAPIDLRDMPRHQDKAVIAQLSGGFDDRANTLCLLLTEISESGCLADPADHPVEPDFTSPLIWPDADPPQLGISRLCGGAFALQTIASVAAVVARSRHASVPLILAESDD